jgi:tetratricopeptide (TPR) repeat protein
MDERERGWDAAGQAKAEAVFTESREALRESIKAAKEAGIGDEDSLTMARGTLALAEGDYSSAREVFSEEEVEAAEDVALGAVRDADQAIEEAVTKFLIRADANYGLEDWEAALGHYEKVLALLKRHSTGELVAIDRQVVGGRIAGCHFHLFVVNSSAGGALALKNKARAMQHYGAFRKTVKVFLGPVRREPEVRFGWGGALRNDGVPRPWLKGIYLPGKRSDVVRMDDGDGAYVSFWSEESSFVLGTTAHVDLETHPFLSWRWMAIELPEKGDVRDSKRIDEALSLAVSFVDESGAWQQFYYGWDTAAPVGTIEGGGLFSLKWKLKVITSGAASLGEWAECRVNLREDIREAYGEDVVPKTVVMLMVQSNTQYTKGSGAGCMGEICFSTTK